MNVNEIFTLALSSLTNPGKTAGALVKKKLSLGDGVLVVVLGALVPAVLGALAALVLISALASMVSWLPFMSGVGLLGAGIGVMVAVEILIAVPIMAAISWLIGSVIIWVVASVLGGKGDFPAFASVLAFPIAAVLTISWIPIVNILAGIYSLYLLYVFLQPTMKMDSNKAAITVIAVIVLMLLVGSLTGSVRFWAR